MIIERLSCTKAHQILCKTVNSVMDKHEERQQRFATLDKEFQKVCANPAELKETTEKLFDVLIDELTLEIIFETHRSVKIGTEMDEEALNDEDAAASAADAEKMKKAQDCVCPICSRTVVASRFAPHLEQCMGMGRKRSRNASRMLNNNNNKERETSYTGMATDDEDDVDWNSGDKRKRKKNNNNRVKKSKNSPKKNGDTTTATELTQLSYETMSEEEKKNLLTKFCGVVSEHTKKICSRSLRCNLHSDEKRKALRTAVICDTDAGSEIVNVDVEGDDDVDTASLRDLLQDNSNTSSPADSASNSNSSCSSKKREKTSKNKNKNSKKDRSSPNVNIPID